jgi:hypothetical protein
MNTLNYVLLLFFLITDFSWGFHCSPLQGMAMWKMYKIYLSLWHVADMKSEAYTDMNYNILHMC